MKIPIITVLLCNYEYKSYRNALHSKHLVASLFSFIRFSFRDLLFVSDREIALTIKDNWPNPMKNIFLKYLTRKTLRLSEPCTSLARQKMVYCQT